MINLSREVNKRRTFAIISHPDAGKTTLTEKLLLFGGAIQLAGAIKGKKAGRHATSDWMELEKQRGISVTTSVMQFPFMDCIVNLLDTPGHADFTEDTYRTLTAVDSALMVIDAAKGVEPRTIKLMEVCRLRITPITTFINKMDRDTREPLELLDEIEDILTIECAPITWPVGSGKHFKGIYHFLEDTIYLYQSGKNYVVSEAEKIQGIDNSLLDEKLGAIAKELREEVKLVCGASHPFNKEKFLKAEQTPVFFGSAIKEYAQAHDIDVMIVMENKEVREVNKILKKKEEILPKKIHAIKLTPQDLLDNLKKKDKVIIDIVKHAIVLYGQEKYVEIMKNVSGF